MGYLWQTEELVCCDIINPAHYVFHDDTKTCTMVYSKYSDDYMSFHENTKNDIGKAKAIHEYGFDIINYLNWFDASYILYISYDSLNIELPDGFLHFAPMIYWGKYIEESGKLMMLVTARMNHVIADGYLIANVFCQLQNEIDAFIKEKKS